MKDPERFHSILHHLDSYKIIGTLLLTKFLGFLMVSFSVLFLRQFIKSGAAILITLVALAALDQTGLFHQPIYTLMASVTIRNWIEPMLTLFHLSTLLLFLYYYMELPAGFMSERTFFHEIIRALLV